MSSEDIVNNLTINYMINKKLLQKLNNNNKYISEKQHDDTQIKKYKEQIRIIFNGFLDYDNNNNNDNINNNVYTNNVHLEKSFREFTKNCIAHITNETRVENDTIVEKDSTSETASESTVETNIELDVDTNNDSDYYSDNLDLDDITYDNECYPMSNKNYTRNNENTKYNNIKPVKTKYNTFISSGVDDIDEIKK